MRMPAWLRTALLLMALQAVVDGLTFFVYGMRWVSLAGGLLLLAGVWRVSADGLRGLRRREVWAAAVVSQVPGLVGTVNFLLVQAGLYRQTSFGDILDFVMETWHTALLPWATLLPNRMVGTFSGEKLVFFFLALPLFSPVLMGWVIAAAAGRGTRGAAGQADRQARSA